ncbi:MAG: LysR family transcriptional regulator [Lachnospiraceae bacterium]|nr:LysR family transcriptional regulator [Lachnospiraceae bacterium]
MTMAQLKYVMVIAAAGSFREASNRLFVSQPALSLSIRELEEELNLSIFERTNKGIRITEQGTEFLAYAKKAVSQYSLIEERFLSEENSESHFSVSMQHYIFAVHAFVDLVKELEEIDYSYSVYETRTNEVLENVRNLKSEVGVVSYSKGNEKVMKKLFREYHLRFVPLMKRDTYVYISVDHPLAKKNEVTLEELDEFPCVSFDQSSESEFYLAEEALGDYHFKKVIKSNDRATSLELMVSLEAFCIGTGNMVDSELLKEHFVSKKVVENEEITIGYITRENQRLSDMAECYIAHLNHYKEAV